MILLSHSLPTRERRTVGYHCTQTQEPALSGGLICEVVGFERATISKYTSAARHSSHSQTPCAMTDIFISYSKADHTLALKLSALLEAEGWNVWWDRNLSAGDVYRDE